jgi:threonine/homoserine/homoserine lactone efflux protein
VALPDAQTLGLFLVAAGVLVAIPGPNHLYIVARSVAAGPRAGLLAALGVELGTAVHVGLAAVGLSTLVAASATAFAVVRYAGVAYLFYLAWRALRPAGPLEVPTETAKGDTGGREVLRAMTVNLLNPKVILFFVAFLPQFLRPEAGPVWSQTVVLGACLVGLGMTSNLVYVASSATVARAARRRRRGPSRWEHLGRWVQAGIYALLGVLTLTTGRRPL